MIRCHCDVCGIETFINPPTKPVFRKEEQEFKVVDKQTGELVKEKRTVDVPEMTFTRLPDPLNPGKMMDHPIQKTEDLKPRMWRVQLRVGQEVIDRDFCKKCLDEYLRSDLSALRDKLEGFERK